jgi:pimeloyl-ACP methyl ester carboxylesterase
MPPKRRVAAVFVHGLAKKPPLEKLKEIWLWGLSIENPRPDVFPDSKTGINLLDDGVPHFFNYYADVFYADDHETDFQSYYESDQELEKADGVAEIEPELPRPKGATPREQEFLQKLEAKMRASPGMLIPSAPPRPVVVASGAGQYEIAAWLPRPVKEAVIRKAAMEAYYFLFDKEYVRPKDGKRFMVRRELRERLLRELGAAADKGEKIVLVSHSMGTMVAYDVLRNCPQCPGVDTLITLGSPLGITEVQDELVAAGASKVEFPAAKLRRWINIYDPLDPVCGADPKFANDFAPVDGKRVEDMKESNWGYWRHTITHYFAGTEFRKRMVEALS